jgi:hypothetical protein
MTNAMNSTLSGEALDVLEAVSFAERFGTEQHFDGDIALAAEDALGRGIVPMDFFELIKQLQGEGYLRVSEAKSRCGYMTNYVELTREGYGALVQHGRAES